MAIKKEDFINELKEMKVLELNELIKAIEGRWRFKQVNRKKKNKV